MSQNNNKYVIKPVISGVLSKYRMFIVVTIAYAIAFIIVYFGIPRIMYLWWGYNMGSNTAIGYYMTFAVPLMMMAPLLLIAIGLIWHVATELTDPVMNAVRQRAVQKLIDDNKYKDKIEVIAENYLNKHLERYGFIKVVKPGLRSRVEVLFKRGQHGESVVM